MDECVRGTAALCVSVVSMLDNSMMLDRLAGCKQLNGMVLFLGTWCFTWCLQVISCWWLWLISHTVS